MRSVLACLLLLSTPAWAQLPAEPTVPVPAQKACADCGVIRTMRSVVKDSPPNTNDANKPSGLVASVPLGSGAGKPQFGSSSRIGGDAPDRTTVWEVVVRMDDGRFSLVLLDEPGEWREGDKVRVDRGKLERRSD